MVIQGRQDLLSFSPSQSDLGKNTVRKTLVTKLLYFTLFSLKKNQCFVSIDMTDHRASGRHDFRVSKCYVLVFRTVLIFL